MRLSNSLVSGLAGALALTVIHDTTRHLVSDAPRIDILGERGIAKSMNAVGVSAPDQQTLHKTALVAHLISNGLYYALVGSGKSAWWRGAVLGSVAGWGAIALPPVLGLGVGPAYQKKRTLFLTVLEYLAGGLAAAAVSRAISHRPVKAKVIPPPLRHTGNALRATASV